ncbi:hypothetical protein AGMMS49546_10380 [Spirochaetia bacterium]|nr:hypothetical protein AGMMS49546_10380 [Spirochaetia bacterium]
MDNNMPRTKLYLETTIFNYYFDADRNMHPASIALFEAIGRGEYEGYTSTYVIQELTNAVNALYGYKSNVIICSPMEVSDYETEN